MLINFAKSCLRAVAGGYKHRRHHRAVVSGRPDVAEAIERIRARWPDHDPAPPDDSPIFLLSVSWRSGSTALQRLILSDPDNLVWGEPFRNFNIVHRLADSLRSVSPNNPTDWELERLDAARELHETWVATMSPPVSCLLSGARALFTTMFREPALTRGFRRWGLKEVRFSGEHVAYLNWLFPRARFVCVHRHPLDAYRSYRVFETWYARWPDRPVLSAADFGRYWAEQANSLLEWKDHPAVLFVGFDDLRSRPDDLVREVSEHVGSSLDPSVLSHRLTGRSIEGTASAPLPPVPLPERLALRWTVGGTARRLGYEGF